MYKPVCVENPLNPSFTLSRPLCTCQYLTVFSTDQKLGWYVYVKVDAQSAVKHGSTIILHLEEQRVGWLSDVSQVPPLDTAIGGAGKKLATILVCDPDNL